MHLSIGNNFIVKLSVPFLNLLTLRVLYYYNSISFLKLTFFVLSYFTAFSPYPTPKGGNPSSPKKFAFNHTSTAKGKTIMDLDSDSDEEDPWNSNSGKNSNKIKNGDSIRRKIKEKLKVKEERESSTSPVPQSNQQDTKSNSTETATMSTTASNTTYYSPTKPTTTDNITNNSNHPNNTIPSITTNVEQSTLSSQSQNHDYSTYDLDRVSGLPAPHSAAAMGDVERLRGFAVKQINLLQSLDQAQRQPVRW